MVGQLNDTPLPRSPEHMAKMRAAKAARGAKATKAEARKQAERPPEPPPVVRLVPGPRGMAPAPAPKTEIRQGWLDVQVTQDFNSDNVTLTVKGPVPRMKKLLRMAVLQSIPFLEDET